MAVGIQPIKPEALRTSEILEAAVDYAERGWRVVPCSVDTKHPPINGWQNLATTDVDQIVDWFEGCYAGAGVSLVFGPSSGIIDIDVDDAADGDRLCKIAFGGEWPETPTYLSGTKKTPHRLFRFSEDLPNLANINLRKECDLDVDLKIGAQDKGSHSLAPPSRGYRWLPGLSPDDVEPAELPASFIAWLANNAIGAGVVGDEWQGRTSDEWADLLNGAEVGARNDTLASVVGLIVQNARSLERRQELEQIILAAEGWNARNADPLDRDELVQTVQSIVETEKRKRDGEYVAADDWRLVAVVNPPDPTHYELVLPDSQGGCVVALKGDEIHSGAKVRDAIAASPAALIIQDPAAFAKRWNVSGGTLEKLRASLERRNGDPTETRQAVVAQVVHTLLSKTNGLTFVRLGDGDPPCPDKVNLLPSGDLLVPPAAFNDERHHGAERPSRREICDVLRAAGSRKARLGPRGGERPRFWSVSKRQMQLLAEIAWPDTSGVPL